MDVDWIISSIWIAVQTSFSMLLSLVPYTVFGILLGEWLKLTSWTKLIYKMINNNRYISVLVAVILGTLSPLCTYGTIPVVIALYMGGVSLAPLVGFLASSSLMNPQLFFMTLGGLGIDFAVTRLLIGIIFSLLCGYVIYLVPERFIVKKSFLIKQKSSEEILSRTSKKFSWRIYFENCLSCVKYIMKYLIIGVVIGALIETFVPQNYVVSLVGGNTAMTILMAALAGIPFYACGGGIIPVVSGLMAQGMGRASAMAFVTVGQATRISPLAALASFVRIGFIVAYCLSLVLFSILVGVIL